MDVSLDNGQFTPQAVVADPSPVNGRWHCTHGGCAKHFARKEHLNRHEKTHIANESLFVCPVCQQKFNRSDSLHRHQLRHGDEFKPTPSGRSKKACIACHKGKMKCDGNRPCAKCASRGVDCKFELPSETNKTPESEADRLPFSKLGVIDWLSMRVRKDPTISPTPDPDNTGQGVMVPKRPTASPEAEEAYINTFFGYFHHRWPFIHRPSYYDPERNTYDLLRQCAMRMIGAWIYGSGQSMMYSMAMYDYLMARLPGMMQKKNTNDRFESTLSRSFCHAILLVVIHSFYIGIPRPVSQGQVLLANLIAILREAEFFNPEIVYKDEKPDFFPPMKMVLHGNRIRLAFYLFKIDTYFSLLRGHSRLMTLEDLEFAPAGSFACWNSDGLDVWELRALQEPPLRNQISMTEMIRNGMSNPAPKEQLVFVEDIQLCLFSMQSTLRRLHKEPLQNIAVATRDGLKLQLDRMKYRLDQMASQAPNIEHFGEERILPYRYYFGFEDTSQEGGQKIVISRVKALIFDALSLYHLLSIHLYTDLCTIKQLAQDQNSDTASLSPRHIRAQSLRREAICTWANSYSAHDAIRHVNEILLRHQNLAHDPDAASKHPDPIAYGGLTTSMLVVWAFCMFSRFRCQSCDTASMLNYVEIGGYPVCNCTVNILVEKFRAFLPERWGIPEMLI